MDKQIKLQPIVTEVQVRNLDETLEKLEKVKSLICEINDLSEKLFKHDVR